MKITDVIYKVLTPEMTSGGYQESLLIKWKTGIWKEVKGKGTLYSCTNWISNWLYCLEHPLLAMLHETIDFRQYEHPFILMEGEAEDQCERHGEIDLGYRRMRMLKKIKIPVITPEQFIKYNILASLKVYTESSYVEWAERWITGKDRTKESANAAGHKAEAVERVAMVMANGLTGYEAEKILTEHETLERAERKIRVKAAIKAAGKVGEAYIKWKEEEKTTGVKVTGRKLKKALSKKMKGVCSRDEETLLERFRIMWAACSAEMAAHAAARFTDSPSFVGPSGPEAGPAATANLAWVVREAKYLDLINIACEATEVPLRLWTAP